MKHCVSLGCALVALATCSPAMAEACGSVSFSPVSLTIPNWDPLAPGQQAATFSATIRRASSSSEGARLIFLDSNDLVAPAYLGRIPNSRGPRYEVRDSSGTNVLFGRYSDVRAQGNPLITLPPGASDDTVAVSYTVVVPANTGSTDFRNGNYTESLRYALQCFDSQSTSGGVDGPRAGPMLNLTIPNLVSLTTASPQTLDFQNFTSLMQQLNVALKSTGPVTVDISSLNIRRMVRQGAPLPYPANSVIDYSMTLNGQPIAANPTILPNLARAGVPGASWPLRLRLPAIPSGKVAGSYQDTITLTLTPGT